MKTQSTVRPKQFTINDLGKKQEIKLCENIVEITNEDGDLLYEYDMELQTILKGANLTVLWYTWNTHMMMRFVIK